MFGQNNPGRVKYNFNSDWKVFVSDDAAAGNPGFKFNSWKKVTLPYAFNENDAFEKDIVDHTTAIAGYRKHFKLPASAREQKVFLEFEEIRQAGDFYLNGKHIGLNENGVSAFGFDITDLVKFDNRENILAARINNDWNYREKAPIACNSGRIGTSTPIMVAFRKMCRCMLLLNYIKHFHCFQPENNRSVFHVYQVLSYKECNKNKAKETD